MIELPDYLSSPLALLASTLALVFLICQEIFVIRSAVEYDKPLAALIRGVRALFFSAIVIGLAYYAFTINVWLGLGVVVIAIIGIAATFALLPRIRQALQGAVGGAVTGGVMVVFGMGISTLAMLGRNDDLVVGLIIAGLGGWMLYSAIQKMSQGE